MDRYCQQSAQEPAASVGATGCRPTSTCGILHRSSG